MIKNLLFECIFLLAGCAGQKEDGLFQIFTIDALLSGVYDGSFSCGSLLKQGDLGIGTFNALDGEMLIMDGKVYQILADIAPLVLN